MVKVPINMRKTFQDKNALLNSMRQLSLNVDLFLLWLTRIVVPNFCTTISIKDCKKENLSEEIQRYTKKHATCKTFITSLFLCIIGNKTSGPNLFHRPPSPLNLLTYHYSISQTENKVYKQTNKIMCSK